MAPKNSGRPRMICIQSSFFWRCLLTSQTLESLFVKVGLSGLSHRAVVRIKQVNLYEGASCLVDITVSVTSALRQKWDPRRKLVGKSFFQL